MGFSVDDGRLKRSGLDYWRYLDITYYENLADFFAKVSGEFFCFTTKARNVYDEIAYPDGCYLLFGKETKGLPEELLLKNPSRCVRLPMMKGIRSLNLANTVAVGVYEALRQWRFPNLQNNGCLHLYNWEDGDVFQP